MLVREGERLTPLHLVKLQAQSKIYPRSRGVLIFLGLFLCLAVLLGVSYQLARIVLRRFSHRWRDLSFVAALLLASTLMNKWLLVLGDNVARNLPLVGHNLVYILPQGLPPFSPPCFWGWRPGWGWPVSAPPSRPWWWPSPFPCSSILSLRAWWGSGG